LTEILDDKIGKLWELLEAHNKELNIILLRSKVAIKDRDVMALGDLAGQIVVIGQADCCYLIAIEILEEVKTNV